MTSISYQRNIDHCEVSPYIKEITISSVAPAENSDNLDSIKFEEMGWNCISQRGLRKEGQKVVFIPPESVLPFELGELLNVTKYLSKGRVRVAKFRGNRSEGLIVEREIIEPYLSYIMKWEDLPSTCMNGEQISPSEVSLHMHRFYKMPNILNEPNTFKNNEELYFSEKIHGTNWRVGKLPHPVTQELQLYTGSHDIVLKDTERESVYWKATKKIADKLPSNILFFGEIFGRGIQNLNYNINFNFKFFAASKKGYYISIEELKSICKEYDLPCVEFFEINYDNIENIRKLSEGNSSYANYIKEGIVLVSKEFPERMAKCINFEYLEKNDRTERH